MKILITGGVGFIGTNAAIYFANKKHEIVLVDNFSRKGVEINALFLKKNYPKIKIIKSDVLEVKNYLSYLKKTDVIIHLAGQTAVTTSIQNPENDFKNNLLDSFTLLESVRKYNPKAIIIYSSTNKVYGDLSKLKKFSPVDESAPLDFISPYGCSKGATDCYFLDYHRIYGLKTVVFRQSCIYGKHQLGVEDQGWVAHFTKQFLFKKPITIFGNGKQIRDLLYVEDLVEAYEKAILNINKVTGKPINIGGGEKNAYNLLQVIKMLENEFGYQVKINFEKARVGDQKYFVSKNLLAKRLLSWQPKNPFSKALKSLINWQKENLNYLAKI
ncbi:MAG: CDP-paratose 2-epimerase [Patescibacteria group bacterium]|nr:MAG: CDP-paratose 2-epimerase [Patescibacteria group bacterium]